MKLTSFEVGQDRPFFLIAGPCVIESEALVMDVAGRLKEMTGALQIPFIFKASFDKANRSSRGSFRGPGLEAGLKAQNYVVGSGNTGVFNAIQALMENAVLPLKLRASLYSVLASDPAVHFDRRVTDFAGQAGVAFYTRQEGYLSIEIVISPRTYAYMGDRYVAYRARNLPSAINNGVPAGPYIHINKGQITGETAVLESGIVAHAGQLP